MNDTKRVHWQSFEQLNATAEDSTRKKPVNTESHPSETGEDPQHSRRDFLRMMGFSIAAASAAACDAPLRKTIPYVNKPHEMKPGIPNYYASTYVDGGKWCSIVVKTREGRPIKVDGNTLSDITQGAVDAQVEASVMSLYDEYRLRGPKKQQDSLEWEKIDQEIIAKLDELSAQGKQIRLVSNTILSPSTTAAIEQFITKYPTTKHIQYDPISYHGIRKANEISFGESFVPHYDFSKAKIIVSLGADFLGTWLLPTVFNKQYAATRKVSHKKRHMSRHYQFESNLSLTGANADYRTMIRPSQDGEVAIQLYNLLAKKAGRNGVETSSKPIAGLDRAAEDLWLHRKTSLLVSGSNMPAVQVLVNAINDMLENYGNTISGNRLLNHVKGNDETMAAFVADVQADKIGGIIFYGCNPVYDHPMGAVLGQSLKKIPLTVSTHYTENETASVSTYKTPDHHYLESWNDFEPVTNAYSLSQPTISPLFNTRQAQVSLLTWAGNKQDYFLFLKNAWETRFEDHWRDKVDFQTFWDRALYNGVFALDTPPVTSPRVFEGDLDAATAAIRSTHKPQKSGFEIAIYESCNIGTGSQANNPFLQESPDPITKAVWEQYATLSHQDAETLGVKNDAEGRTQYLNITVKGHTLKVPALVQPGQAPGTIGIAVGYGRTKVGKVAENLGLNTYPLAHLVGDTLRYHISSGVAVENTGEPYQLAQTQIQSTYMGRYSVIQEARLEEFKRDPYAGRKIPQVTEWEKKVPPREISLWKGHEYKGHHWGMAIDLNTCTGCGTCVVACNIENNVAVVGKDEVVRRREMHWLRIDRYYSSQAEAPDVPNSRNAQYAAENPEVVFQPMLCQHCNNAPCETVCPVAATTHSTEGLNQMTYNRCIGTRYCANNCPYKVRRFNWFKYHHNKEFARVNPVMNTDLGRMILNPDVTVRSRGVMEKCSFCVQRIQAGKLKAKKAKRPMKDGEIITACQAACTSGAIVFGDMNDTNSHISQLLELKPNKESPYSPDKQVGNPRAYRVLEEIGVKPNIFYLTKIKNKKESKT